MKPTLHLICNAHLDPVWQWRWEEGASEALSTFRTAVEILREHHDLLFNHNEAVLYRWVQTYDPVLFGEIQKLVEEGRWCISGGWHLQPDVNIPGIESIIRHIAEGRDFFHEYFGVTPTVAYNFDSFGHSGGLPQVLALAGYRMYIHMRPQPNELALPSDLYRWRGVDGTEITGLRIAVGLYHTERDNIEQRLLEGTELALILQRDVPVFWGIGDHGGGPTRRDLSVIDAFMRNEDRVHIVHSTPERLWEALAGAARNAPVVDGDLQRCFTGTYTSLARLKRRCHESLGQLVQAEAVRTATWWMRGQEYPAAELGECWRDHLFNDFHDILPGSCTQPAEQDALDQYGRVAESVRRIRLGAAVWFNHGAPRKATIPVTLVNSDPAPGKIPVEVDCMLDLRPKWTGLWHLRLFDDAGREVPCQEEQPESLLPFNGWRRRVSFLASPKGVGASTFELRIFEGTRSQEGKAPALAHSFNPGSGLVDHLRAGTSLECLAGPLLQPLVVEDDGDAWGSDHWSYRTVVGRFEKVSGPRVIQTGPIRTITESVLTYGRSRIVFDTYAYPDWPVIEVRLRITWNEIRKRLKLSIPTVFRSPSVLCDVPGGAIARPADGEEHVHGRWFLLQGRVNETEIAFAVAHNGLHGLDFQEGEVRLSVVRSAAYCHEQGLPLGDSPERKYMDIGLHDVRLAVTAGDPDAVRSLIARIPDLLAAPPIVYAHLPIGIPAPRGLEEASEPAHDLFSLTPGSARMLCCKRSKDGRAMILRLHETAGRPLSAAVTLARPSLSIPLSLKPFEIRTLRIEKTGAWKDVHIIDEQ
jgi:alpha-mannosidase